MPPLDLPPPDDAPVGFHIRLSPGPPMRLTLTESGGRTGEYVLASLEQPAFLDLFEALARDFGLRRPEARKAPPASDAPELEPLLTEPVSPKILYGYGDPCVVRAGPGDYRLLVTSNDAPDAFPILVSRDLKDWRLGGFVFPEGAAPSWALTGRGVGDFWAPELHRVAGEWIVCFAARRLDRSLAIGLARSASPDGPFVPDEAPIVAGGVIDPHILIDAQGAPWLVWKRDDNGVWPRVLGASLHRRPALARELFAEGADLRSAVFALTLWPWIAEQERMTQFFALQPMIEAAAADLSAFEARLAAASARAPVEEHGALAQALETLHARICAQRLSSDARRLEGEPVVILRNDQPWEGHLVEGPWITAADGAYYLLYAGNDFSTANYGIGAAVAPAPQGPYRKIPRVLLRSNRRWWGPGHPSLAFGPDGRRLIFLHAFRPHEAAYKGFRALLAAPVRFEHGDVRLDT